jgi:dihydrofolate reductase
MPAPQYNLIVAATLDGKIARSGKHQSTDWTSKEDALHMRGLLNESDVIVLGRKTYELATPLQKRNCIVFTGSVKNTEQKSEKCLYINPGNKSLTDVVKEKGYQIIAVLGGAQTYNYFLANRLISNLYLTIEPVAFGNGVSIFNQMQDDDVRFELKDVRKLNDTGSILLHYTLAK